MQHDHTVPDQVLWNDLPEPLVSYSSTDEIIGLFETATADDWYHDLDSPQQPSLPTPQAQLEWQDHTPAHVPETPHQLLQEVYQQALSRIVQVEAAVEHMGRQMLQAALPALPVPAGTAIGASQIRAAGVAHKRSNSTRNELSLGAASSPSMQPHTLAENASRASVASSSEAAATQGAAMAETDVLSRKLFSQSHLAVLASVGLRDMILSIHAELDELPLDLPNMLEWHSQCALLLIMLSDMLSLESFAAFLTGGLTPEQLRSRSWLTSPLANWVTLETRPFYLAHHRTRGPNHIAATGFGGEQPSRSVVNDGDLPEMRHEWLPRANILYQRWQTQMVAKILLQKDHISSMAHFSSILSSSSQISPLQQPQLVTPLSHPRRQQPPPYPSKLHSTLSSADYLCVAASGIDTSSSGIDDLSEGFSHSI